MALRRLALLFVVCSIVVKRLASPFQRGDGTAQGVAKARHMETIYPVQGTQKRLFEDPYAAHLYSGAAATAKLVEWTGALVYTIAGNFMTGVHNTLVGRTREFDEQVRAFVAGGGSQLVILGAGYDTRSLRLGLPGDVKVFEVDQPKVQAMKVAKLASIPGLGIPSNVHFVPIDFNVDDVSKLRENPGYDSIAQTLFILEGVSQYIPKVAIEGTIATVASMSGNSSKLLISYVPQDIWDAPERCGIGSIEINMFFLMCKYVTQEPWITGFHQEEFASLMQTHGFEVKRDVSLAEFHSDFFAPAGRPLPEQQQQVIIERYVTAVKR